MIVRAVYRSRVEYVELKEGATARDLILRMGLNPSDTVALRMGTPIPLTEHLQHHEEITLLSVASGG